MGPILKTLTPENFQLEKLTNAPDGFDSVFIAAAEWKPAELSIRRANGPEHFYPGTLDDCRRLFAEMSGQPVEDQVWQSVWE